MPRAGTSMEHLQLGVYIPHCKASRTDPSKRVVLACYC